MKRERESVQERYIYIYIERERERGGGREGGNSTQVATESVAKLSPI